MTMYLENPKESAKIIRINVLNHNGPDLGVFVIFH